MPRPNLLIVMTDHQRADTVLPEHPCRTPRVEALGRDGLTLTNTFCPAPHCCPARATFMSGLYPTRSGIWNNVLNDQALRWSFKEGVRLWSEDLAAVGYAMHYHGKWHASGDERPADRGWIEHAVSCLPARGQPHGQSWERIRDHHAERWETERGHGGIRRPGWGIMRLFDRDDACNVHDTRCAAAAAENVRELTAGSDPWCCFVGLTGPHDPYNVPGAYLDRYPLEDIPLPASYHDAMTDKPNLYRRMREQVFGQLMPDEVRDAIRHFWAYCSWLDDRFGEVLDVLDASEARDDTLVLYCSDHGDYCGEHGLFAKGIPCFTGAYQVPAVIRWPAGLVAPGRREDRFVSLADFGPTFRELTGAGVDQATSGASLVPFLCHEEPTAWREEICTQLNGVELYVSQRSVRTRDWHYTFNGFDFDELYDLANDPEQMRNLAADARYDGVKRDLCKRLWRFAYAQGDTMTSHYITIALAPYGPALAFEED